LVRAVVFDLDGTLIDSAKFTLEILRAMLKARGVSRVLEFEAVQHALSLGGEALMRAAFGSSGEEAKADLKAFRATHLELPFPSSLLYPGTSEMLAELTSQGLKLGICTKKPFSLTMKVLGDVQLTERFTAISGGDSVPFPKPDARHLQSVLDALGVTAAETLFVGDSDVDAETSKNTGVRFVFARFGYDHGLVKPADCVAAIDALSELPTLCKTR
jgi:phosphoglycolate phosphatase